MSIRQGNNIIAGKSITTGLEVGDIGISLFVDESKGLRRYLNGSIVIINTNTQAFLDKLKRVIKLYPSITCTESEWQTIKTMSVYGQCGKFVIDETAGTIRLPRIVMPIQGLTDLTKLGEMVEQGLPNIIGDVGGTNGIGHVSNLSYGLGVQNTILEGAFFSSKSCHFVAIESQDRGAGGKSLGFNASRSSSIYKDGANVQQEQVQYPYFIQIATGQETQVDIVNTIELNNPYSLFDCKFADHLLNNASWLRADTFEWNSGDVYVDAYNLLVEEYATGSEETEDGITFKRTSNGFKIALDTQETAILSKYNTDGIAWYYILDTDNKRFKLPRTKWGFKGLRDDVGTDIDEKVPNITGDITNVRWHSASKTATGCFAKTTEVSSNLQNFWSNTKNSDAGTLIFSASDSSSTYQDGAPVQERGTQMYLYFYVGETVQNANLIDAGRIQEQLTNKVDVASSWGFPSSRYIDLTLGASGTTYTAPANGWYFVYCSMANVNAFIEMNVDDIYNVGIRNANWNSSKVQQIVPIQKGHILKMTYSGMTFSNFRFIYAEGSN